MGTDWTLRARCEDGVLVVAASGRATSESLKVLRGFILTLVAQQHAQAVLVDFTEADAEMNPGEWFENARETAKRGPILPLAMVVRPEYFDVVVQHCFDVAEHGLRRMAFTDPARAFAWALSRVVRPGPRKPQPLPTHSPRLRLVP